MSHSTKVDTILKRFRRYSRVEDIFGSIGIFVYLFKRKIHVTDYFSEWKDSLSCEAWNNFFSETGFVSILGICVVAIYFLSRTTARKTTLLLTTLFPSDKIPQSINRLEGRKIIAGMVAGHLIAHLALIFTINNIFIFCIILQALFVLNLYNNHLQRINLRRDFNDKYYAPKPTDYNAQFIKQRRSAVTDYIFNKNHTERECRVLGAAFVGSILAGVCSLCANSWGNAAAYIVVICALILNEWTVFWWRRDLYMRFDEIEDTEDKNSLDYEERRSKKSQRSNLK